jgi:hypothetical protein
MIRTCPRGMLIDGGHPDSGLATARNLRPVTLQNPCSVLWAHPVAEPPRPSRATVSRDLSGKACSFTSPRVFR